MSVILDLAERGGRPELGDGFRVVARVTVWEARGLVAVPVAAIFRQGGGLGHVQSGEWPGGRV